MKVLITSGGTKIKIDMVRSISNMSRGTFGSQIADSFLEEGWNVDFLAAKDSRLPKFSSRFPAVQPFTFEESFSEKEEERRKTFRCIPFVTFEDYERELFSLLKKERYDAVILAAAVSDYGVENFVDGKIRTSSEEMVIKLRPLPKLITKVRDELSVHTILVGFKLLVSSTEEELLDACKASIEKNRLDVIVGNDLRDIRQNNHTLLLGSRKETCSDKFSYSSSDFQFEKFFKQDVYLPDVVRDYTIKAWGDNHIIEASEDEK